MKRINNIYESIISIDNLKIASYKAQKGKTTNRYIKYFNDNKDFMLLDLNETLSNLEYKTSKYDIFKIYMPKERDIYRLPFFPDRIIHHAIMNVLEDMFVKSFIKNTYACVKKRGIHKCLKDLKEGLKDKEGTKYCLKIDIKKFYPSIDNDVLKVLIRKKIKCKKTLILLDEIIDSEKGMPIGNYLSQYFANFYLTYFDHYCKEDLKLKYYYRYADDIVILHSDKKHLKHVFNEMEKYLDINLKLEIKSNWQIFPVCSRGIDFVGYVFFHSHILLRKSIKIKLKRAYRRNKNKSLPSYNGWAMHCNSINLLRTLKMKQKAQNGLDYPLAIEDLGTGFYHFNYNIEEIEGGHKYDSLRLKYPVKKIDIMNGIGEVDKLLEKYIDEAIQRV